MEEKREMMDWEYLRKAADCLKIMAHPIRLRIVELLSGEKLAVGKIAEICKIPPNQASEHMRMLQNHGLLDSKRDGRTVYYMIKSKQLKGLLNCIKTNCPCS